MGPGETHTEIDTVPWEALNPGDVVEIVWRATEYGPGFFRIGGEVFEGPVMVTPGGVAAWAGYDETDALVALADSVDVLFLGTGDETRHPPVAFRQRIEAAGLGLEAIAKMNQPV